MNAPKIRICTTLAWCCLALNATAAPVDFVREVRPIFEKHCYECHGEKKQKSGLRLDVKAAALKGGDEHAPDIIAGKAKESPLLKMVLSEDKDERMPPKGEGLSEAEIATLTGWINEGAAWPDGVDVVKLKDKRDHWSFKPLKVDSALAEKPAEAGPKVSIDAFVMAKLKENGLAMSPPAGRVGWLRRVTFDLTGLPPTPEEVDAFSKDSHADAFERVVERLLKSERYGERWAQHWLDVVRYADTHGFEVNTERPNAWPYRDYVIRAFNKDTPYDRFIREQIAGDALGEDAATGFLVTASVLLPGQIGKDAPSIRLARQDALDEIVSNIGQTFLGLSVGCARCHDHKFDPIPQRDYYAMQAFVSGVEYADREMRGGDAAARKREAAAFVGQVKRIDDRLARFVPMAHPDSKRRETDARQNVESFAPVEAKFVRFTIHDSNLHPTLGLIEPCIDEFEIFTDELQPRNVALASHGTKVIASGTKTAPMHKLEHINDGRFGNARSWMSSVKGRGWVMFELPQATRISKVVWSRDREGKYDDRLPTAFTLEAGLSPDRLCTIAEAVPPRPTVNATPVNTDRFKPVRTKRVRFTILATNSLEPCLDEIEVFNTAGQNIALASLGTKVTTSGNTIVAGRHEPDFINDGLYGNEHSWLGNETGKGWVELEFASEQEVTRVLWSRDREGKFRDRLPTEYRAEVGDGEGWQLVADSTDRRPHVAGVSRGSEFTLGGLTAEDAAEANRLLTQKTALEARIKAAESGQKAFAGTFRTPDEIHLLNRGDPEQPKEEVIPAALSSLGDLKLAAQTAEQERRKVLAGWIASPQNPLTARVMANRIWQGHFGTGLVQTPTDFGNNGVKPTHPALLDWLAQEFIRSGWSVKHMHRLIVLSETYRQSSASNPGAAEKDADVRLLWRFPSRRLEAETIRDTMLFVSSQLNLQMYGRGYDLFDKRGGLSGFNPVETFTPENQRRMIYAHKVRRETEVVFGAFDCPDAGQSTALRRASTTPIQALNLFNSRFTLVQSEAFAARVKKEAGGNIAKQIRRAYQLALDRDPGADELRDTEPVVRQHGLATLCRALFNSNEFLFLP
jgi:mono/diheme cytochrome c family protein